MDVTQLVGGLGVVAGAAGLWMAVRSRRALFRAERQASELAVLVADKAAVVQQASLLASIVESTSTCVVLFTDAGRIVFTNAAARDLLFDGAPVEGQNFLGLLQRAPEPLRRALLADGDELFSVEKGGERETFHLSKRHFQMNDEPHTLVAVKPVGAAIAREENAGLKKVIRIIGHEIGNSLGPITSLIGSARTVAARPDPGPRLATVFDTIEERTRHLQSFLEGYAKLARLPAPRPAVASWRPVLDAVHAIWPCVQIGPAPDQPGYFDTAQIQQVVINLVKNACEAGGSEEEVAVLVERGAEGGSRLSVLDRGAGMSDEVMQSALLPFFTTKPSGGGLGLALSREIVDLHRGRLRLTRREGGGMVVSMWLPDREGPAAGTLSGSRVRMDLTRS